MPEHTSPPPNAAVADPIQPGAFELPPFLSFAARHELLLAIGARILSSPQEAFTGNRLQRDFREMQDEIVPWLPIVIQFKNYCGSLVKSGAVTATRKQEGQQWVTTYSATTADREIYLAHCGSLIEWSLQHSQISIQTLLGQTALTPVLRYNVLRIVTATEGDTEHEAIIATLKREGVINKRHKNQDVIRTIYSNLKSLKARRVLEGSRPSHTQAVVSLHPDHAPAARDLVGRFQALRSAKTIGEYAAKGAQLIDDPATVRALLAKAARFSAARAGVTLGGPATEEAILSLVQSAGSQGIQLTGLREALEERRIISSERLYRYLQALVKQGKIQVREAPRNSYHARYTWFCPPPAAE